MAKLLTVLCFALACGLLIGSLTAAHKARAGTNLIGHANTAQSPAIKT